MTQERTQDGRTSNRGFASMKQERQKQIASMGGRAVPDEKRSFSQNRRLAAEAGRKGGQSVPGAKRSSPWSVEAMTPSRGASCASRSSHMTRSTPSIASARVDTEARIASRSLSCSA